MAWWHCVGFALATNPCNTQVTCYETSWDAGRAAVWMALEYMVRHPGTTVGSPLTTRYL